MWETCRGGQGEVRRLATVRQGGLKRWTWMGPEELGTQHGCEHCWGRPGGTGFEKENGKIVVPLYGYHGFVENGFTARVLLLSA